MARLRGFWTLARDRTMCAKLSRHRGGDVLTITEWTIRSLPLARTCSGSSGSGARHRVGRLRRRVLLSQQGGELGIDPPRDAPALIDESRIEIDAGGAGAQHRQDVLAAADPAIGLDRDASAGKLRRARDIVERGIEHGAPVQCALLHSEPGLGYRASARDLDAVDAAFDAAFDQLCQVVGASGIVRDADDCPFAPSLRAREDVAQQADIVEA